MKILLAIPPLTQLNTAFPSTAQLLGFLRSQDIDAAQCDLSIELIEALFTKSMLGEIFETASQGKLTKSQRIIQQQSAFYCRNIEPVMPCTCSRA